MNVTNLATNKVGAFKPISLEFNENGFRAMRVVSKNLDPHEVEDYVSKVALYNSDSKRWELPGEPVVEDTTGAKPITKKAVSKKKPAGKEILTDEQESIMEEVKVSKAKISIPVASKAKKPAAKAKKA